MNEEMAKESFIELQEKLLNHYGVIAKSRYVDLKEPKLRAHVLEAGSGPPVIILHGGDGEAVTWAPQMALFARTGSYFCPGPARFWPDGRI